MVAGQSDIRVTASFGGPAPSVVLLVAKPMKRKPQKPVTGSRARRRPAWLTTSSRMGPTSPAAARGSSIAVSAGTRATSSRRWQRGKQCRRNTGRWRSNRPEYCYWLGLASPGESPPSPRPPQSSAIAWNLIHNVRQRMPTACSAIDKYLAHTVQILESVGLPLGRSAGD